MITYLNKYNFNIRIVNIEKQIRKLKIRKMLNSSNQLTVAQITIGRPIDLKI